MASSSSSQVAPACTTLQTDILNRVCTATDVVLQYARKHYDKEIIRLQSEARSNPFSASGSETINSNLDRRRAADEQMSTLQKFRNGNLICSSNNSASETVTSTTTSLLNLVLHALCLCRMPNGPKSAKWLEEINKLIPSIIQATSTAEICRDNIMMHLFRAGGFDLMPEVIQKVKQHSDATSKQKLFDTLHSHIVWTMMTDQDHFDNHIGWLPLIDQGVIDINLPFELPEVLVQMIFPAKRGKLTTTIKEQFQERLKRELTGPLGLPTTADAKYPRFIEEAPRNIVALQPSTPRVVNQDHMKDAKDSRKRFLLCMLYICRKCDKDFAPEAAPTVFTSADAARQISERSKQPDESLGLVSNTASSAAPSQSGDKIAKSIDLPFSLTEEEACMKDYCNMGSHRLAVNYATEAILEDVNDLPTVCCNLALVYLDKAAAMTGTSPSEKENLFQNAAAYAYISTIVLQFEKEGHTSFSKGIPGKAWYRLGSAFLHLKEYAAATCCCRRAEELNTDKSKLQSLKELISRSISAKQLKEKMRKADGEGADRHIAKLIQSLVLVPFLQRAMKVQSGSNTKPDEEEKMLTTPVEVSGELPLTTIAECKARGNAHFVARRFDEAESEYKQALRLLSPCAGLIAEISHCFTHYSYSLNNGGPEEADFSRENAVAFSMCAMMVTPSNVVAHLAHVRALMELEWRPQAQEALNELDATIVAAQGATDSVPAKLNQWQQEAVALRARLKESHLRTPIKRQSGNISERQMYERTQQIYTASDISARREENEENEEMAEEDGIDSPSDSRIMSLHVEYANACIDPNGAGWPVGVNRRQLLRILELSSLNQLQVTIRNPITPFDDPQGEEEHAEAHRVILHRLATRHPSVVKWWLLAPIGEHNFIFEKMADPLPVYTENSVHNFSNYISWPLKLRRGTTHVAVGFVDLGQLRTFQFLSEAEPVDATKMQIDEEKESATDAAASSSADSATEPLVWIGYELVPVNVAKCEVLLKMLQRPVSSPAEENELINQCLLVWYSSTWSPATLSTFRETVDQILAEHGSVLKNEVREVLEHWQKAAVTPLPLRSSRAFYLQDAQFQDWVVNFTELADRMALITYGCTRDVLPPTTEWVASVTMFQLPQPWQCATADNIFNVIPLEELLEYRDRHSDIIVAAREYLRDGVRRIRELLVSGRIRASVEFGNVEIDGKAAKDIQKLQPASISWSNISDYAKPRDFHKLLKQVSVRSNPQTPPVVHSMYTMNWMKGFKGTYYVDYECEDRDDIFEKSRADWSVFAYKKGLQKWLLIPEVANRWNTCMWPLGTRFYKQWIPEFFAFQRTGVQKMAERVEILHAPYWYIGARCAVGMGLQFSYDG